MHSRFLTPMTICLLLSSNGVLAQKHHHAHDHHEAQESHVQHEAHVHGTAELLVVLEGNEMNIVFKSPAANVVGFEHRAKTTAEKARLAEARDQLTRADELFELTSGTCSLVEHHVDFGTAEHETHHDVEEHHDHRHEEHSPEKHSDIEAEYRFQCERPKRLRALTTAIPTVFPGVESLSVQSIVHGRQNAAELNAQRQTIRFR